MADSSADADKGKQPAAANGRPNADGDYGDPLADADDDDEFEEVNAMDVDDTQPGNTEQVMKKDKTLAELLLMMDDYAPIVPDAVTDYYLSRAGFESEDIRLKRLLALASQKFIADIATDALQWSKIRQQQPTNKAKTNPKDRKTVLTMEDLTNALSEHGVNLRKPEYFSS
ncbi:hypothetical protein SeMB42_g02026 [Synchytrium endobioticum]|uniref:Transcription initiation factor TFIID subunit 10 n=1 Tax=Synchytrium endobioticum TaxID=286115 RepID=A0A507D962_9FUNG|nr:hypothetical protein SeLEV6574_g02293 [Synchytrium endobioticum]TPX51134.1 hypothetical protein SeMB42_g02026 [Synchytrium endobioticum]